MWNRKRDRILDLEARLEVALRARESGTETVLVPRRFAADAAKLRELETQRNLSTQAYLRQLVEAENANAAARAMAVRLKRALRACARYRAEAATQAAVTDRLTEQLLDAIGYPDADRARLNNPVHALTGEAS